MHICTKYEVSMFNHVAKRVCTDNDADANDDDDTNNDDANDDARQTKHDYIRLFG